MIPTLDVVNDVLASYIAKRRAPGIDLTDRSAVHAEIFEDALLAKTDSFYLPLVLATETVEAYTEMFEITRTDLLRLLALPEERITAAALGLATPVFGLVTTPNTSLAYLRSLFSIAFAPGVGGVMAAVDVQDFLRSTGLTREELGDLIDSRFVSVNGTAGIKLEAQKASVVSVQNDVEPSWA